MERIMDSNQFLVNFIHPEPIIRKLKNVFKSTSKVKAVIKTILYWVNEEDTDSHCLIRIFLDKGAVTVIISELRCHSCHGLPHSYISSGMVAIAKKLYEQFPNKMSMSPDKIIWIKHYGQFSTFDWQPSDELYEKFLTSNNGDIEKIETPTSNRLTEEDIKNKLGHLDIKDVNDDLKEIGWTKHLGKPNRSSEKARIIMEARKAAREAKTNED
jgi:hypothetical protein